MTFLINSLHFHTFEFPALPQQFLSCIAKSSMAREIKQLSKETTLNWNASRQQLVLDTLRGQDYFSCKSSIRKICSRLEPSELHLLIKTAATLSEENNTKLTPSIALNRLKELLSLEQIEAAIKTESPSFESSLKAARDLNAYGKHYLHLTHPPKITPFLKHVLHNIIWSIELVFDTLLTSFGITQLLEDSDDEFDAYTRLYSTLEIIATISAMATLGATITGSLVLGGVFAAIGAVSTAVALGVYLKYVKPAPRTILGCQNIAAQAASGAFATTEIRSQYVDALAFGLVSGKHKPKTPPLLIGASGVGKTEIIKGFAKAVAEGRYDDGPFKELAGKQIFYINTADLMSEGKTSVISLEKIKKKIKHRPEDVILIFDEIHEACRNAKSSNMGEKLKTLLDEGVENFPYVIGATTDEEFVKYIQPNESLARRFKQIPVNPMDHDETIALLTNTILKQTGLRTTNEVIESLYLQSKEAFPEKPQPYIACRILNQIIVKIKDVEDLSIQEKIEKLKIILEKNLSKGLLGSTSSLIAQHALHKEIIQENDRIQQQIDALNTELNENKVKKKMMELIVNTIESNRDDLLKLSLTIEKNGSNKRKVTSLLKEFALKTSYISEACEEFLKTYEQLNHHRFPQIDDAMIKEAIENELELERKKKDMLAHIKTEKRTTKDDSET